MTRDADDFVDLGLRPELLAALSELGYEEPTPIQSAAIGPILAGRDLLGQAATGTGKTAAFALPILQALGPAPRAKAPVALVLVPTRELCIQVSQALHRYGRDLQARVLPIYGGAPIVRQLRELDRGVDVVVATPGRAVDHLSRKTLDLRSVQTVVLDEADEMLDMGFADDLETILQRAGKTQRVLFSATIPRRLNTIIRTHLDDPVRIEIEREVVAEGDSPRVRQTAYIVPRAHKAAALGRLLDIEAPEAAIVFCRTRAEVDQLTETMRGRGYRAEPLHGGMSQEQRDRVMGRVRSGTAELLIATDVAARGLDIEHLTHVFNYDVPSAVEPYVHRKGRIGRAGREGVVITLAEPREHRQLRAIERATKAPIKIEKVPSSSDLRVRRLEMTKAALHEALLEDDDLERFRVVVDTLSDEFDVVSVALAAVKLAHQASNENDDDEEIPEARQPIESDSSRGKRGSIGGQKPAGRGTGGPSKRTPGNAWTKVWVSAGRNAGIRPQDLVGAIAGETRLSGRDIGAIDITDGFSLVEVPDEAVDEVIAALSDTRVKGRKVKARVDSSGPRR